MSSNITCTRFLILRLLDRADHPLWKKKIYEKQEGTFGDSVSSQTIGRHVDTLQEEGLIESQIVSPDNVQRDLLIAYSLTAEGRELLEEKREETLQNLVREYMFTDDPSPPVGKDGLVELIAGKFDYPAEFEERLMTYTFDEILTILALDLLDRQAVDTLGDSETVNRLHDVVLNGKEIPHFLESA